MMPILKDLFTFKKEGSDETFVYIDDFFKYIKFRLSENDRIKLVRTNLLRELKGHKGGVRNFSHGDAVTICSVFRYIFNHFDDYIVCHDIGTDILNVVLSRQSIKDSEIKSLSTLYEKIAELDIKHFTLSLIDQLDEDTKNNIPSIDASYKTSYSDTQWLKICLFENHFTKYVAQEDESYEIQLKKKWTLMEYKTSFVKTAKCVENITKTVIQDRCYRKKVYEKTQDIEVWAQERHNPAVIETQLIKKLNLKFPDVTSTVVCIDTKDSVKTNSLMVVLSSSDIDSLQEQSMCATNLMQRHHVNVSKVITLPTESLEKYNQANTIVARFHLRDDIITGKLKDEIIGVFQPERLLFNVDSSFSKCDDCFQSEITNPLSLQGFNLLQEWFFEVPLDIQMLFEMFINRSSLKNSSDKTNFLLSKLERFYGIYDMLFNTYNKNFSGILQQANTDELAMHYHSITTVFQITSSTGISSSYVTAERKIKEKANDDVCYYNTFLKRYPLQYESSIGFAEHSVSLRDCHLILMMDNLVRLTFRADPDPGESRSGQLCTLPLTLQGLPKDNIETRRWHQEGCSMKASCDCKRMVTLQKEDFDLVLVSLSTEEKDSWDRFQMLLTWGNDVMWKKIKTTNLVSQERGDDKSADGSDDDNDDDDDDDDDNDGLESDEEMYFDADQLVLAEYDDFSEIHISSHDENFDHEENLDSLFQTANLIHETTALLSMDPNMSGIFEYPNNELEESFGQLTIESEENESSLRHSVNLNPSFSSPPSSSPASHTMIGNFGFRKCKVPPLLCRHPPPAIGKDDDIFKLKEILDDIMVKTGRKENTEECFDRILFGPDNKIGANLIQLIMQDKIYQHFLPEFPLLHLRKSKINTLFSAYKDAGLLQLLMFMCDDDKKEWTKLLSMAHIDVATRYVRRLSISFHIAFLCRFLQCIYQKDAQSILDTLEDGSFRHLAWSVGRIFEIRML